MYADLPRDQIASAIEAVASQYPPRLSWTDPADLRRRPTPDTWSPLEYACHVRDVLRVQRERCSLALAFRDPAFESMRPDERIAEMAHVVHEPTAVATSLADAAGVLAALFDSLSPREWDRTGRYPLAGRLDRRDLTWIGRHTVHELVHHLGDVTRAIQPTPGSASG